MNYLYLLKSQVISTTLGVSLLLVEAGCCGSPFANLVVRDEVGLAMVTIIFIFVFSFHFFSHNIVFQSSPDHSVLL